MKIEQIAEVCHEANAALCRGLDDNSQKPWAEAEEWQRESAVKGVLYVIDHPDAAASAQHDAWCADKLADGWQYGEVKDADAKTHPCLVAFEKLPAGQQAKDHLFEGIVRALEPLIE